jgi:uncharacterized lipoprotein YajG
MQIKMNLKLILSLLAAFVVLTGCGSSSDEPPEELSLLNENGETVSLTNKDRATVLFHFTEVG